MRPQQTSAVSGCQSASYYSTECQRIDRPLHKLLCSIYQRVLGTGPENTAGREAANPSTHRLAIILPNNTIKPALIWLNCLADELNQPDASRSEELSTSLQAWTSGDSILSGEMCKNNHGIKYFTAPSAYRPDVVENKCFSHLSKGYRSFGVPAYGSLLHRPAPVIVMGTHPESNLYRDVTLSNFHYVFVQFAMGHNFFDWDTPNLNPLRRESLWTKAVVLSAAMAGPERNHIVECKGDLHQVELGPTHPVRCTGTFPGFYSSLSLRLGYPIMLKPFERECRHGHSQPLLYSTNIMGVALMMKYPLIAEEGLMDPRSCIESDRWGPVFSRSILITPTSGTDTNMKFVEVMLIFAGRLFATLGE